MTKKVTVRRRSELHFEKIPVAEVVKKIVPDDIANGRGKRTDDLTGERRRPPRGRSGYFHGVQFYNDPDALCRIVGGFVGEGLEQGALALLIATPDHAARIDSCLRARGIDIDELKRHGSLVTADARETLQLFMADGMPNSGAFRRVMGSALTQLRRGREQATIRAYGEMVDLLWKDGLEAAAIRLETLWNQLAASHDFKLLCGYSMGNFYKGAAIEGIHNQHSHLVASTGDATELPDLQAASATPA
jgi:superfamily I DNA/RNA helicase